MYRRLCCRTVWQWLCKVDGLWVYSDCFSNDIGGSDKMLRILQTLLPLQQLP